MPAPADKPDRIRIRGGRPLEGPGYFVAPTVLTDVDQKSEIVYLLIIHLFLINN